MGSGFAVRVTYIVVYCLVLSFVLARRQTPERRRRAGDEWARQHLAIVDPRWTPDVDRCLERNRRVDLWGGCFLGLALWSVPPSLSASVACLAACPAVVAIAQGYTATRPDYLPPGRRVARLRELSINDYLSPGARRTMWGTAVVAAAWAVVSAIRTSWWLGIAGVVVLAAAAAVEVTGARFARLPEPAGDAAHLYWQDAMRADVVRSAASFVPASAGLMCVALIGFDDDRHMQLSLLVLVLLMAPAMLVEGRARKAPAAYMRSRLWPSLTPHQRLRPGDPVPTSGVVA